LEVRLEHLTGYQLEIQASDYRVFALFFGSSGDANCLHGNVSIRSNEAVEAAAMHGAHKRLPKKSMQRHNREGNRHAAVLRIASAHHLETTDSE
jgi:hypothetical protein